MNYWIGCSGFSYKEWKDHFYPPKLPSAKWFQFYCSHFNTLELNVAFYRFPTLKMMQGWYEKSPANFLFAVKAPRLITHYKQLKECEQLLADFYGTCEEGLKDKLGTILFQFAPQFDFSEERLSLITQSLNSKFSNAVEFRRSTWWREEVYTQLKKHHIIFCGINYPGLPTAAIANAKDIYYRFHGNLKIYYSEYEAQQLKDFADAVLADTSTKNLYCYFNNTASMAAIKNATTLKCYFDKQLH